jgi:hypothetical protein
LSFDKPGMTPSPKVDPYAFINNRVWQALLILMSVESVNSLCVNSPLTLHLFDLNDVCWKQLGFFCPFITIVHWDLYRYT